MNALATKPDPGRVRAWARANGIPVSRTGTIAVHVRESYLEAHPGYDVQASSELSARNSRPDLFALADDMVEAEMIRTGRMSVEPPAEVANATSAPAREEPRSLSEWLAIRDELAEAIAEHAPQGTPGGFREVAEALLVQGWMKSAAA